MTYLVFLEQMNLCNCTFDKVVPLWVEANRERPNLGSGQLLWGPEGWGQVDGPSATSGRPSQDNSAS